MDRESITFLTGGCLAPVWHAILWAGSTVFVILVITLLGVFLQREPKG
jgi:hypothetical protein